MSHFLEEYDQRVVDARAPLHDPCLSSNDRRFRLRQNWKNHLRVVSGGIDRPVCLNCACKIYKCSKAMLYPPKATNSGRRSKGEANAARATVNVSVSAWFYSLMETLDVMPDTGNYQVQHGRKKMLYDDYILDVGRWPSIYSDCDDSYFNHVWSQSFPNVKLRKHCRFAKCEFCIDKRDTISLATSTEIEKADARDQLRQHLDWAHTRERGFYHAKRNEAIRCPEKKLSISIDGTDQFINGFPHFWEISKLDSKGKRLYFHTQIVIVHGVGPQVYLSLEDIAGDPNWTIETLYRTLKAEEQRRPDGLPRTLYLQMDNCFRENKNTFVISYLCWLVERGVFDEIFLSFLPTGHTHFDPDQFASRIATAVRFANVHTCEEYSRIIRGCWGTDVPVEWVHDVMDLKELFNPGKDDNCPVATSRVRRTRGIGTKSVQPGREWFMAETSPLHWRIRKDAEGKVFVQSKFTVDDDAWGQGFYPWTEHAPRPDNREHDKDTSGLVHSDVALAPNNPLSDARAKELAAAIQHVRPRLSDTTWEETQDMINTVTTLRTPELPANHGAFAADFVDPDAVHEEQPQLFARPVTMFSSQSQQNRAREQRKTQGHASNPIVIGDFLAYTTDYTSDYPQDKKQDCWVGKIIGIDTEESKVHLARWHTGTIDNLNTDRASNPRYRAWQGDHKQEWIEVARVLQVFKLTAKGNRITKRVMRQIVNALKLHAAYHNQGGELDIAVGQDVLENPSQLRGKDDEGDEGDEGDEDDSDGA